MEKNWFSRIMNRKVSKKQCDIHVVVKPLKDLQKPSFKYYVNMFYDDYFIYYYQNKKTNNLYDKKQVTKEYEKYTKLF